MENLNKTVYLKVVALSVLVFLSAQTFAGGGWLQKKNDWYAKINQWVVISDEYFTPAGDIVPIRTTGVYTTSLYAEYGLSEKFNVVVYFPFFSRSTLNKQEALDGSTIEEGDELTSVGDTDLTLKYGLIQDKSIVVSLSLTLGLPLGNPGGGRTELLQTGDGEFNQMLTVDASHSFYPVPAYVSLQGGFNNRTNGFSDEWRYGLEAGYTLGKLTAIIRFQGVKPLDNGNDEIVVTNGVFSNNLEFLAFTPELAYSFTEHFGLSLATGQVFYGKRVLANPSYSGGLFWSW